jgi:predicted metal-dependent HD superfamily phosphohydrolase
VGRPSNAIEGAYLLSACAPLGLELPPELLALVQRVYASPGRVYHDVRHVEELARRFEEVDSAVSWDRPREVYLAVLFHDAVYTPGASDNEAMSAALAIRAIGEHLADAGVDAERVAELVRLTTAHGRLSPSDVDADGALFLDCDMSILGSDHRLFDAYEAAIALEYAAMKREDYIAGRLAFLRRLVERPSIFLSSYGRARWEDVARKNLASAIARLGTATARNAKEPR